MDKGRGEEKSEVIWLINARMTRWGFKRSYTCQWTDNTNACQELKNTSGWGAASDKGHSWGEEDVMQS